MTFEFWLATRSGDVYGMREDLEEAWNGAIDAAAEIAANYYGQCQDCNTLIDVGKFASRAIKKLQTTYEEPK